MKKIIVFASLFLSATALAHPMTIFNNSKHYAMAIKYRVCVNKNCPAATEAYIPNAKLGQNFIQVDGDYLAVTAVTEKDKEGNVRLTNAFPLDEKGMGCLIPPANMFSHPNAIILDDIRGTTVITCTQAVVA